MSRIISVVLNQILSESTSRFTAQEVAEVCEVSTSMISKVKNDEAELSMNKVRRLSVWLTEHGDTRLARCFLSPDFEIAHREAASANGTIDDEMTDMVRTLGYSVDAFRGGDRDGLTHTIQEAERILSRFKAERDRL